MAVARNDLVPTSLLHSSIFFPCIFCLLVSPCTCISVLQVLCWTDSFRGNFTYKCMSICNMTSIIIVITIAVITRSADLRSCSLKQLGLFILYQQHFNIIMYTQTKCVAEYEFIFALSPEVAIVIPVVVVNRIFALPVQMQLVWHRMNTF